MKRSEDSSCDKLKNEPGNEESALKRQKISTISKFVLRFEPGKWLIHISLPVEFDKKGFEYLENLLDYLKTNTKDIKELKSVSLLDEFHISLSKPFLLKNSQSKILIENVQKEVMNQKAFLCKLEDVIILPSSLSQIEIYEHGENELENTKLETKVFVALKLNINEEETRENLEKLVKNVNTALVSTSKSIQLYYKNPIFHISVAYLTFDFQNEDKLNEGSSLRIKEIIENFKKATNDFILYSNFSLNRLKIKCGNKFIFSKFD
ncbi:unnamed protein product [Brachionus calyciflorus]|uniref:U6 snRNA phosphodiesterase 1 n=1 Tax=Brachionus calyciflorus TaxID=104777 RepID=A0A813YEA3_9BILA|nr:unnamed protein product [Brachionus calyciflorus]